jgi:hypothetical protein
LLRFWWIVALGVVTGLFVAVLMVSGEKPVYTAPARIFVTSAEGQYVRLSVPRPVETSDSQFSGAGTGGRPLVINEPPNYQPLLAAANLYPLLIESDDVAELREKMFGQLPGTVLATAYTSVSTPTRFTPAQLPIIDILATSSTAPEAVRLAQATADTFKQWIRQAQVRAGIAPKERILIEPLRAPRQAFPSGGPSYGVPILAALALAAAFAVIAVVLDQLFPRGRISDSYAGDVASATSTIDTPSAPALAEVGEPKESASKQDLLEHAERYEAAEAAEAAEVAEAKRRWG